MIGLSTPTYDPAGAIILPMRPANTWQGGRRGSVTATLDGGAVAYDTGSDLSDRTITATLKRPTRRQLDYLRYLSAFYSQLQLTTETGAYLVVLSWRMAGDTLSLSARVIRAL